MKDPTGKEQFLEECREAREDFAGIVSKYSTEENNKLRTESDTLLIMYDQLVRRVSEND